MEVEISRQSDLVKDSTLSTQIFVIGAGGIGSFTVLTLAKMGFNHISVIDDDIVEKHNLPNQFYRKQDMGKPKCEALAEIVLEFADTKIETFVGRFPDTAPLTNSPVIIPAVDNMETRKMVYERFFKRGEDTIGIVDGRMGGQQAEVYIVDANIHEHRKIYKETLWDDSETSSVPCTGRAIIYNVLWIASTIVNGVRLLVEHGDYPLTSVMDFQNSKLHQPDSR